MAKPNVWQVTFTNRGKSFCETPYRPEMFNHPARTDDLDGATAWAQVHVTANSGLVDDFRIENKG